jgi:hypothetical protein
MAVSRSNACTSRKSQAAVSGGATLCQVAPPSTLRSTVPLLPVAQTTLRSTTQRPRRLTPGRATTMRHSARLQSTGG